MDIKNSYYKKILLSFKNINKLTKNRVDGTLIFILIRINIIGEDQEINLLKNTLSNTKLRLL